MNLSPIALGGFQQAANRLDLVAGKIARLPVDPVDAGPADSADLATSMVELLQAQRSAEANLVALKTADQLSRSTLDVLG